MAKVVITARIMPLSPEEDLKRIEKEALETIAKYAGEGETRVKIVPIAFGLQAIDITFILDEKFGTPEKKPRYKAVEFLNDLYPYR